MAAKVSGFQATILNLRKMKGKKFRDIENEAATAMGAVAFLAIYENITRRDYSLRQLADMDHPYAARHGTIKVHPGQTYLVHTQTGKLARSLSMKQRRAPGGAGGGSRAVVRIGFLRGAPIYAYYVLWGTKVMQPRNVLVETVLLERTKRKMMRAVINTLGPVLRSQAGLRFGGD